MDYALFHGDCLELLKTLPSDCLDSLVTDPPAGIFYMGKEWDHNKGGRDQWIEWMTTVMREALRVLKPGAHGLVWALPRTSHWTAKALEDAGFEVRDVVTHLFGTGFPKSKNIGKGWGTGLKPASEHWILVRKPLSERTTPANVRKWGTGALNIDGTRIGTKKRNPGFLRGRPASTFQQGDAGVPNYQGRYPTNLTLDEKAASVLDFQTQDLYEARLKGGASRFFYVAKASRKDKGGDNSHPTVKPTELMAYLCRLITPPGGTVLDPFMGSGSTGVAALREGFDFIGMEQDAHYLAIAQLRLSEIVGKA